MGFSNFYSQINKVKQIVTKLFTIFFWKRIYITCLEKIVWKINHVLVNEIAIKISSSFYLQNWNQNKGFIIFLMQNWAHWRIVEACAKFYYWGSWVKRLRAQVEKNGPWGLAQALKGWVGVMEGSKVKSQLKERTKNLALKKKRVKKRD